LVLCTWLRIPSDYQLRITSIDDRDIKELSDLRWMHTAGLVPSLVLVWLQVSVLAAIGVALSTRFSLVVNLPTVILLYVAGNLTRFMFPLAPGGSIVAEGVAQILGTVLPYLGAFDLRELTVYRPIALAGTKFAQNPAAVQLSTIWIYLGLAALYGATYVVFALSAGMWSFRSRDLGGAEG
jgi:hypothetical protein